MFYFLTYYVLDNHIYCSNNDDGLDNDKLDTSNNNDESDNGNNTDVELNGYTFDFDELEYPQTMEETANAFSFGEVDKILVCHCKSN